MPRSIFKKRCRSEACNFIKKEIFFAEHLRATALEFLQKHSSPFNPVKLKRSVTFEKINRKAHCSKPYLTYKEGLNILKMFKKNQVYQWVRHISFLESVECILNG